MRHDPPAFLPALGSEVDEVVGGFQDVEIVLDDDQRVPRFEQLLERGQQLGDVVEVEAGRRLVEHVENAIAGARREMRRDLDALRFSARQGRRRLAEAQIAEADFVEHLQPAQHLRVRC